MSLRGRLEGLRRQAHALASGRSVSCTTCMRSRDTAKRIGLYEEGEEILACVACGHPVTSTGQPIGYVDSGGEWRGKIIVLEAENAVGEGSPLLQSQL